MYRNQLLAGNLRLPSHNRFISSIGRHYSSIAANMFKALWYAYLESKGSINLTYWSEKCDNAKVFNLVLMSLSKADWIVSHSIPARNWAEAHLNEDKLLQYCTANELEDIRAHNKFKQYILTDEESTNTSLTRLNGKLEDTGLTRVGFCKAGNSRFTYDQQYMELYKEPIRYNLTKSMDKIAEFYPHMRHDRASYDTISVEILDYHLSCDKSFTRGNNYNDSRGRAISSSLSKVANPISCKDFRSLLVIPEA